jgi:hypothetical protein
MPTTRVRRTYVPPSRGRKGYYRKAHRRRIKGPRLKTTRGEKFRALERKIYADYRRRGFSKKRAREIARATAGKVFWRKFGKKRGSKILRRER